MSILPMDSMQRGNAGLAFSALRASAPTGVELALLSFTGLEGRSATLLACSAAPCCATETPYCATGQYQKFLDFFNAANRWKGFHS